MSYNIWTLRSFALLSVHHQSTPEFALLFWTTFLTTPKLLDLRCFGQEGKKFGEGRVVCAPWPVPNNKSQEWECEGIKWWMFWRAKPPAKSCQLQQIRLRGDFGQTMGPGQIEQFWVGFRHVWICVQPFFLLTFPIFMTLNGGTKLIYLNSSVFHDKRFLLMWFWFFWAGDKMVSGELWRRPCRFCHFKEF